MKTLNRLPTTDQTLPAGRQGLTTQNPRASGLRPLGFCLWSLVFGLWSVTAFAATYDIKQMTPEVQQALEGRKERYSELRAAKAAGIVRETPDGLVAGAEPISSNENRDRFVIYQTIAEQNNLGADGLQLVQKAFAEVHEERG